MKIKGKLEEQLKHASHMMRLYYGVSLRAKRRAALWRETAIKLEDTIHNLPDDQITKEAEDGGKDS